MKKRFEIVQVKPSIGLAGQKGTYEITYKVYHTRAMADIREMYVEADDELDAYHVAKHELARRI